MTQRESTSVSLHWSNSVAVIRLFGNHPKNVLDLDCLNEIGAALSSTTGARAVVLAADGDSFSAGRDLKDERMFGDPKALLMEKFNPLMARISELRCPTYAAVQGAALGAGFGLAFACDIVIASEDALIGSPFAKLGGLPDCGFHLLAAARIGTRRTLDLIYSGRLLSGTEAAALGLVDKCVPRSELMDVTMDMADTAARGPTEAFALSKSLIRRLEDGHLSLADVLQQEAEAASLALKTDDAKEGLAAFLGRRSPVFQGR